MKFLIALSLLASASVFADDMAREEWVNCYDTAQGSNMKVVYKLKDHNGMKRVVYPFSQPLIRDDSTNCLVYPLQADGLAPHVSFCPGEGQRVNGLVPVEATYGQDEDTVYCDRKISRWFHYSADFM